jgi:hypothetical protein
MRHRTVKENERVRNREDKQEDEFSVENIQEKTEATNAEYAAPIFKRKTPRTIRGVKRIHVLRVLQRPQLLNSCYWIEWIIEFESLCKKRKNECKCEERYYVPVESKYKGTVYGFCGMR